MSTTTVLVAAPKSESTVSLKSRLPRWLRSLCGLSALTLLAFLLLGYHPYVEDAGVYVPGIKLALHPGLYGIGSEFVTAHMRLSLFAYWFAALVRLTHLPLSVLLLAIQLLSLLLLLFSVREIARLCFSETRAQWGAVTLVAVTLATPVAGSSLFLFDPYVTGRSFSTPFILLAVCACIKRRPLAVLLALLVAGCFHPLMAIYAAGFILVLWAVQSGRIAIAAALCGCAVLASGLLQFIQRNAVETSAYLNAALSRTYFYLGQWHWYELIGLAGPLLIFALLIYACRNQPDMHLRRPVAVCAITCLLIGVTAIVIDLLFARASVHTHLIARLQVMRNFHVPYLLLFTLLGGLMGRYWLRSSVLRWALTFAALSAIVIVAQLRTWPATSYYELPGQPSHNQWVQAFQWMRANTPQQDLVALDADYITADGEDAHNFRTIAERNTLADYSKDGGAAAIFPELAPRWMSEHIATAGLSSMSDEQRIQRLAPMNVTWVVLQQKYQTGAARTAFACPYRNATVQVCKLPALTL